MRRPRFTALFVLLLFALLVVSAQAGTAKPEANNVKRTARPVLTLAMDGPRVAYMRTDRRVGVWNVLTGATSVIKGAYPSKGNFGPGNGEGYGEVAIAGTRVALITRWVIGNSQESQERLYTAPLGGSAHQLGSRTLHSTGPQCFECGNPGFADGSWMAGLVGSGKILAVSTWKSADTVSSGERLRLVTPSGLRTIATGAGTTVAESADAGHIAVVRSTVAWPADEVGPPTTAPTVGIYSAKGKLLREIALNSAAIEVALSGNRLVVLTKTFGQTGGVMSTLEVYDWTTGTLVQTWPVAVTGSWGGILHLVAYGGLAVVEEAQTVHVVEVATGKDVLIAATGGDMRDVAIGPRGMVYADQPDYHGPGKLVFVPMAQLLAVVNQ